MEMRRLKDQPVVYLSHPVMVVPGRGPKEGLEEKLEVRLSQIKNRSVAFFKWPQWICRAFRQDASGSPWSPLVNFSHGHSSRLIPGEGLKTVSAAKV